VTVTAGVTEHPFRLPGPDGPIPGILWSPATARTRRPLVLLGHGGSGHKRSPRILELATWFVVHAGLSAAAIDGPDHGDRRTGSGYASEHIDAVLTRMTTDWLTTVDTLASEADTDRLAYVGMSMGTRFGLPTAVALGSRLRAAVLGKFGLYAAPASLEALSTPARTTADARRLTAPTLFHLQWDDEVFPREGQLTLFDHLASPQKQLIAYPGPHATTPPTAIAQWRTFVVQGLRS
jgi:dienelactone hydrolase